MRKGDTFPQGGVGEAVQALGRSGEVSGAFAPTVTVHQLLGVNLNGELSTFARKERLKET